MKLRPILGGSLAILAMIFAGCERDTTGLEPFPLDMNPVVFDDTFPAGVDFQAFLGSKVDAISIDDSQSAVGTASLRVTVPDPGDPSGTYAGGALTTRFVRDLSSYDAVTFWAKASRRITLDIAGLGNDNTGTSRFEASWSSIALDTTWKKYAIPIPLPAKLAIEGGLFFFAEGPEGGAGSTLWFDEIRYESLTNITNPRPLMQSRTANVFVGQIVRPSVTRTTFAVGGTDQIIAHSPNYFSYLSSDGAVAQPIEGGVRVIGGGSAMVTAKLDTVAAAGTISVNANAPPSQPAPAPTLPQSDVISLFSNVYVDVPVNTWSASWDQADVQDFKIQNDDVKAYTNLVFAGIEFTEPTIDASAMTHFHLDVWATGSTNFRVKLVDFGADGAFGGGDDREHELTFNPGTTPAFVPETWSRLEIPLSSFVNLTTRGHLAQLILSGASPAFVDNVYFHK